MRKPALLVILLAAVVGCPVFSVSAWAQKPPLLPVSAWGKTVRGLPGGFSASVTNRLLQELRYVPPAPLKITPAIFEDALAITEEISTLANLFPASSVTLETLEVYSRPFFIPAELIPPASSSLFPFTIPNGRIFQSVEAQISKLYFPDKERVDAVIFDMDGTLLDSLSAWDNSGVNFLRSQGIEPPEGLQEKLTTMSLQAGARLLKREFNLPQTPEEILEMTIRPIRERYFTDIMPKPGVPELLQSLRAQGIKLCVATASDRELAEAALGRLGLLDEFDFIITCDEVGVGKRSPLVYEEALQELGTEKARTVVVEDALYALETAKKAGFMTVGVADVHSVLDQAALRSTADYYVPSFRLLFPQRNAIQPE